GWCIKLKDEVFTKDEFRAEAPKHFVLVELDFPRKTELAKKLKEQNDKLQVEYQIEGFPTIYLTDADGRPYAKTGYQQGGAEKYLEHLAELRKNREKRDASFKTAASAKGIERAKALAAGIEAVGDDFAKFYRAEVDEIIAADKDGKAGLKTRFESILKKADMKKDVQAAFVQLGDLLKDRATAKPNMGKAETLIRKLFEKYPDVDGQEGVMLTAYMSNILAEQEKYTEAIAWLVKLKKLNPRAAGYADKMIKDFEKKAEKAKEGQKKGEATGAGTDK
ncbi:MAG: thioredoxin family protein, partial [Planctomycetes bacterium]|nr:thioredoxin family protein [Planctomycetota bacterium]